MMALKMGLRGKSVLVLGSLLLTALLVMGGAIYYQAITLALRELLGSTEKSIDKDVMEIEHFVRRSADDLMVIAATPPIRGIIRARDNNGIDSLTGDKTVYWYARLEQIFTAFLTYHPEYCQLRYLDEKGDEIVRANRTGNTVLIAPRHELQNKSPYPYFFETMRLKPNGVYYSEVNLNRERGVIEIPHTPVFRVATPVYDAAHAVRGVVVINVLADDMFSPVRKAPQGTNKYLVNQNGDFLVHPDRTREYAFDLGFTYHLDEAMPEYQNVSNLPDHLVKYHKDERHVDGYQKIYFDPAAKNRSWTILYEIPESTALKGIYQARNTMLIVGLFIAALSMAVIIRVSTKKMVSPLLRISGGVGKIESGDFSARIPEAGLADEFEDLAASINRMAGTIEKNINELGIFNRITVAAASSLSVDEIARNTLDAIMELRLLKFEKKAAIFVADDASKTLRLAASRGFSEEQRALDAVVPFGDCLCGRAAAAGETIVSERCCDNPQHTRKYPGITPHGHLIIPLKSGQTVIGVLVLYLAADSTLSSDETRLYKSIADVLAVSLQNARRFQSIEQLKNQHGLILNSLGEGLYELDDNGICTFINPVAERLLGYGSGELTGVLIHAVTHHTRPDGSAYPREECRIYESFRRNAVQHVDDEVFWRKDGSSFPVEYTGTPIRDDSGAAIGAVVVFSDITERRKMDDVLKGYSRHLEHEVAERTQEIQAVNSELEAMNKELELRRAEAESATRAKSDFLANMSHELRTPLNSILGFSEILRDGLAGVVNAQQKEYLNDVWESGSHLLRLINDILDISKIEAGKMELELGEVELHGLLRETMVFFQEKAARHSISLLVEVAAGLPTILADERKVKQVLINLLTNALKFTPDGGEVGICTTREGGEILVSVWDTGIGIAPEDLGRLFQPFQQLESPLTKKHEGTGLGLSLCRKIVELHGGRIWVESTPGEGSRFTFVLPIAAAGGKS